MLEGSNNPCCGCILQTNANQCQSPCLTPKKVSFKELYIQPARCADPRSRSSCDASNKVQIRSKVTASDSNIPKKCIISKTKIRGLKNKENVKQLRDELKNIKKHLCVLTQKQCEDVSADVETCYVHLHKEFHSKDRMIENLKQKNKDLKKYAGAGECKDITSTKKCLDEYEDKLNILYREFMETAEAMNASRDNIRNCIKDKASDFQQLLNSKLVLESILEENDIKYQQLAKCYEQAKNKERKYAEENTALACTLNQYKALLKKALNNLKTLEQKYLNRKDKEREKLCQITTDYKNELLAKNKQVLRLNKEMRQMQCSSSKTSVLKEMHSYKTKCAKLEMDCDKLLGKIKYYDQKLKQRSEELQAAQKDNNCLVAEVLKLRNASDKLTRIVNEHNAIITNMHCVMHERENLIDCQRKEITLKDKQIEVLSKTKDCLKGKVNQLQEDLVGAKINGNVQEESNSATTVATAEDGLNAEVQSLITALYAEIDNNLAKDEQLREQKEKICSLQKEMHTREKKFNAMKTELELLREQCVAILDQNATLTNCKLKAVSIAVQDEMRYSSR